MKEGRKKIGDLFYLLQKYTKIKSKMVVSLPGLISPDTKMKGPVPKQIN